jgi:hypothetical protein
MLSDVSGSFSEIAQRFSAGKKCEKMERVPQGTKEQEIEKVLPAFGQSL